MRCVRHASSAGAVRRSARFALCLLQTSTLAAAATSRIAADSGCTVYSQFELQRDGIEYPISIACARDGRWAVVERDARRVRVFGANGAELLSLSEVGGEVPLALVGARESGGPRAVAFDANDRLTVAAAGRVALFDSDGVAPWRLLSGLPTLEPTAIAWRGASGAESSDELLVVDRAIGLVAFGADGTERWRTRESLVSPLGLALAPDGVAFVSDTDRHAIVRFGPDGACLGAFGERGAFPGLLNAPAGLAIRGECLYVADELNHRVVVSSLGGSFLGQWGMHAVVPREGQGKIHYPVGIAITADGGRAWVAEAFERRVQRFAPDPTVRPGDAPRQAPMPSLESVLSHFGPALGADGDLLVLTAPETANLFVFDLRGTTPLHVSTFGGPGPGVDKIGRVAAVGVDADAQRVVVLDVGAGRLSIHQLARDRTAQRSFDPFMARLARAWTVEAWSRRVASLRGAPVTAHAPVAIARAPGGWWIYDASEGLIVRTDATLEPREVIASGVRGATGLAVRGAAGQPTFLLATPDAGEVVHVAGDGAIVSRDRLRAEHPTARPTAVALSGDVQAVTDPARDVVTLTRAGEPPVDVGRRGTGDGEFWLPDGIATLADGRLVVIDRGNHRVQILTGDGAWALTFGLGRAYAVPRQRSDS